MITIEPFDTKLYDEIKRRWDRIAKPLDGLGRFEEILSRIGAVQGTCEIDLSRRALIVLCGDNGIVRRGVSQSGQEVTGEVASWMGRRESSVCRMAAPFGIDVIPVDIGINMEGSPEGVRPMKIRRGTSDFVEGPAMTPEECEKAVSCGIGLVRECKENGYRILATGEMGIGNTTTSAVLAAALLGLTADEVAGRGAGLDNAGLSRKTDVIGQALAKYVRSEDDRTDPAFAGRILSEIGGLEIAGLTGVFIGGALYRIPVIVDGFISAVAALLAERIAPGSREFMIASHSGREKGMKPVLRALGLEPVLDADLALGEGTGAVMLIPLLDMALSLYRDGNRFDETAVSQYQRFEDKG